MNIGTTILLGVEEFKSKSRISAGISLIFVIIFATVILGAVLQEKTYHIEINNGNIERTGNITSLEDILAYAERAPKPTITKTWQLISSIVSKGVKGVTASISSNNIFQALMYVVYTIQGVSGIVILIPSLIIDALRYVVYFMGFILIL